jgi:hypothetical protein
MTFPYLSSLHSALFIKIIFLAISICILISCKKNEDIISFDSKSAEDEIALMMVFDDVDYITYEGIELSNNIMEGRVLHDEGPLGAACVSYSFSIQNSSTTIDFGNGCLGPEGKIRKGKLSITQTGKYFEPGTIITTVLDGYTVNDILLEGSITMTNISSERTMTPSFSVRLENGKATWSDQSFATRDTDYTRLWKRSSFHNEVEYFVSGPANGLTRDGGTYTSIINSALSYKWVCLDSHQFFPVEGKISFNEDQLVYIINYGNGDCDNKFIISLDEHDKLISLF